jgi:hypothetical protein
MIFMNMYSKALIACLACVSSACFAGPFPESATQAGLTYYRTGQAVQPQYLADSNVIKNYHHYHLDKPVDGYEWVHGVGNDYLLVSTKSGILKRIEERANIPPESTSGN